MSAHRDEQPRELGRSGAPGAWHLLLKGTGTTRRTACGDKISAHQLGTPFSDAAVAGPVCRSCIRELASTVGYLEQLADALGDIDKAARP